MSPYRWDGCLPCCGAPPDPPDPPDDCDPATGFHSITANVSSLGSVRLLQPNGIDFNWADEGDPRGWKFTGRAGTTLNPGGGNCGNMSGVYDLDFSHVKQSGADKYLVYFGVKNPPDNPPKKHVCSAGDEREIGFGMSLDLHITDPTGRGTCEASPPITPPSCADESGTSATAIVNCNQNGAGSGAPCFNTVTDFAKT